jgi:Fic family protein
MNWPGLARSTDPQTSHEAAISVDANRLEMVVLAEFRNAKKGLTADELAKRLPGLPLNTITPRIAPLVRKGYLMPTGRRKAASGRFQRVLEWVEPDNEEQSLDYFNRYIAGDR